MADGPLHWSNRAKDFGIEPRLGGESYGEPIKGPDELAKLIVELEEEMIAAAEDLRFEEAARIRDELKELRRDLEGMRT